MSMLLYDVKKAKRWIILWMTAAMLFFVIFGSVAVVWHKVANPNRDIVGDEGKPKIGLDVYATGTFEVFECISEGPSACPEFEAAKSSLTDMSTSFSYTPLREQKSPGKAQANGTRTVTLTELSDQEWQQVGQAVMRDGQISPDDVLPEKMDVSGSRARFSTSASGGKSAAEGVVTFEHSGDADAPEDVQVMSVTYTGGG